MCCFSGPVRAVEATKIFARAVEPGRQVLVYEMKLAAEAEVAMILPIPTPPRSADDALRFISLERYPEFFADVERVFPVSAAAPQPGAFDLSGAPPLVVHSVGAFVASFVPSLADFARLDARFRLPSGTLERVPGYADWGFAVFQLRLVASAITRVHPMAFEFATRDPSSLFFPTLHIHDGQLHPDAEFAHQLFGQHVASVPEWWSAGPPLKNVIKAELAAGLVDLEATVARKTIFGPHPNRDVWVALG